ncbi:MAG: sugar transferase [Myxococcales bacterium]|nr:sugar transferase [Myxococcales bacterium]
MTFAKRAFDVAAATFALALFSPVLLVAASAIALHDGGSVLFVQERVGRDGASFRIFKLRTMRDEVVTGPGRWLRATGIDEVPQFLNVLRGDMSVVGPRPLTRADLTRLGFDRDPLRATVRPGITGPAQVFAPTTAAGVLDTDRRYVREASLRVDAELVAISFAMNVFGKRRVRARLAGHRLAPAV